jgi:hypothetical protein
MANGSSRPKFGVRGDFSEGLAVVDEKGKRGYLARNGKLAIPFKYDSAKAFSNGVASVAQKRKWGVIDHKGRFPRQAGVRLHRFLRQRHRAGQSRRQSDEYGLSEGAEGLWGVIDKSGKWILEPQYETLEINGDLIKAWKGGYHYFALDGRPIQVN